MARRDVLRAVREVSSWDYDRWMNSNSSVGSTQDLSHLPDSTPISLYVPPQPPASIRYEDRQDLKDILRELHENHGAYINFGKMSQAATHEAEHAFCVSLLDPGTRVRQMVHLALKDRPNGKSEIVIAALSTCAKLETTKLGATALALFPRSLGGPSQGDLDIAAAYGHDMNSAIDAIYYNNDGLDPEDPRIIPLPLTHLDSLTQYAA